MKGGTPLGSSADSSDLEMSTFEGLLKGLDWILENLQEFAITNRFNFQTPNLKDKFAQLKPISELAIALSLMKRCSINHELIDVLLAADLGTDARMQSHHQSRARPQ